MSKHLELKDAQMTIQKLEEHLASIGSAKHAATAKHEQKQRTERQLKLAEVFAMFDLDASGFLEPAELFHVDGLFPLREVEARCPARVDPKL